MQRGPSDGYVPLSGPDPRNIVLSYSGVVRFYLAGKWVEIS